MWLLVVLCVNINNPKDVPGRMTIEFATEQACIQAQQSVKYWLKFDSFKITTSCQKQSL
jgi:hypothetical protein